MFGIAQARSVSMVQHTTVGSLVRHGAPQGERPRPVDGAAGQEYVPHGSVYGSHMPLDVEMHWQWHNPLNLIPGGIILLLLVAVVGALAT
ncbi:MAG: hypothetical protein NVS2B7_31510 [Herpetosiphon sp.]